LEYFDIDADIFRFKVRGNHEYDVEIRDLLSGNVETSCTCPYNWGEMCKHEVAALKYLSIHDYRKFNLNEIKQFQLLKKGKN